MKLYHHLSFTHPRAILTSIPNLFYVVLRHCHQNSFFRCVVVWLITRHRHNIIESRKALLKPFFYFFLMMSYFLHPTLLQWIQKLSEKEKKTCHDVKSVFQQRKRIYMNEKWVLIIIIIKNIRIICRSHDDTWIVFFFDCFCFYSSQSHHHGCPSFH